MTKLFTLGCSLSDSRGWKDAIAEKAGIDIVNSAMYASSNNLQVRRMHSHIINNEIDKDDIIIWQVTSQMRTSFSVAMCNKWVKKLDYKPKQDGCQYHIDAPANYFDGIQHVDVLSNHPIMKEAAEFYDFAQSLEELLSTIILLNNSYKVLVFVGWQGALDEVQQNFDKFTQALATNNVPHMPESLMDWVLRNDMRLDEHDPAGLHPTMESSEAYGEQALYPKLQELGWL